MLEGVEAGDLGSGDLSWQDVLGLGHGQKVPFRLGLSIRVNSFLALMRNASSANRSASKASSQRRS